MDRKRPPRSFDQSAMRSDRVAQGQLLLSSYARRCPQSCTDETYRRDLYREALPWLQSNYSEVAQGSVSRQSQTDSGAYEEIGAGRNTAWTKHIQGSPRTSQISISPKRSYYPAASSCMEHRYHVYSALKRFCIPGGSDRLVQSIGVVLPSLKQPRNQLLLGSLRGSDRTLWVTANLQHRPEGAIHFPGVCECRVEAKYSIQHRWTRAGARQHLCRASMEVCKI